MSTTNQETVYEGWLTKSPPTKRIWRARWRRRWFALKQSGELPGQYFLEYFTDRNCRKLKGTIDLDQCEQVDAGLRFERRKQKYQYMFDVKTPGRTYYLAADNEADMNRWVDCICRVCGLKADEEVPVCPNYYNCGPNASLNAPVAEQIDMDNDKMSPTISEISGPYIPISECFSGKPMPLRLSHEEMGLLLQTYTNELSPLSPTSIPPSYAETMDATLNTCNPRFYDSPRKARPCSNLNFTLYSNGSVTSEQQCVNSSMTLPKNHGRSSSDVSFNTKNGKVKTRPPDLVLGTVNSMSLKNSPTDSESVFTEDEWTHPVFPQGSGPRPSDSSIENENVPVSAHQRFSRAPMQVNFVSKTNSKPIGELPVVNNPDLNAESTGPPPRPPKPVQFQNGQEHGYLNLDTMNKSSENIYMNKSNTSPLIGPRTASTIVMDDFYDIPRSHQDPNAAPTGRHCYTNAAPHQVPEGCTNGKSLVFTYDFESNDAGDSIPDSVLESSVTSNSLISGVQKLTIEPEPKSPGSISNTNNFTSQTESGAQKSPAPIVNRGLKPRHNANSPPSIDRKLKPSSSVNNKQPSTKLNIQDRPKAVSCKSDNLSQYSGTVIRNHRAAPSPTPPKSDAHGSDDDNTIFSEEQIYFYSVGNKFIPATPTESENIQYLDLDLESDSSNNLLPKSPGPSTVYKEVDFVKTEAFKITKQSAEKSRTEKQNQELKKDSS